MEEQKLTNEEFFDKIKEIKDVSILRDILQFYQNEYSNFFSDASNLNQKIASLFNLSAIFLGYFITVITFLLEHKYFSFLKSLDLRTNYNNIYKLIFAFALVIGLICLFTFTCRIFKIHKVREGYEQMNVAFPVVDAYEERTFKKDREKEFLIQMIYNSYKIVKNNYILFEELANKLKGQHDKLVSYVIIIAISLLFIIFSKG